MKNIINKKNILKGASVLLIISILIFSNLSVIADSDINTSMKSIPAKISLPASSQKLDDETWETIFFEDFTNETTWPPYGWELNRTNQNETWHINKTDPNSAPNCAKVCRHKDTDLLYESLITPSFDWSKYSSDENRINLRFWWYTETYLAWTWDYIDLNVSISTDGGKNWVKIWTEDNIANYKPPWRWIDTNDTKWIDVTKYAGESSVKIRFLFYSNSLVEKKFQRFGIDDVEVLVNTSDITLDHGGHYNWWWHKQKWFTPKGVRFHGTIIGLPKHECLAYWEFGDGVESQLIWSPVHFYPTLGNYTANFTVYHPTTQREFKASCYVNLFLSEPPYLKVNIPKKNQIFGVEFEIENPGSYDATYLTWRMNVSGGLLQRFERKIANDSITIVEAKNTSKPIKTGNFVGIGLYHIMIVTKAENLPYEKEEEEHFECWKFGPLLLNIHKT